MAKLPTRSVPRRALTASAQKLNKKKSDYSKRLAQGWQMRALQYYDQIGELRFTSHFLARQMSRVRLFPAIRQPDGRIEPITSGLPVDLLNLIQDPGGGRSQLQFDYGRMQFITGEGVLFGTELETENEYWRFLWREEVKFKSEGQMAVRVDAAGQETNEVGVAYRMWTPHPRHSDEADSPMRAVLDIAEELLILTASVRSTAVSRMTNGIIIFPSEISPPPSDVGADEDPEANIFLADYMEHVQSQIENPGTPEASVPFGLEAAYDYADRIRWMTTHDPQNDYLERELRIEAVKRLALGLDLSPEDLLGYTDANHWTAKQVQHDRWRMFGVNRSERFADDLNRAYLQPALENEGYANWRRVVIGMDDAEVVIAPDRSADADLAYDRGQINDEGYLELKGIPDNFAATEEDKRINLAIKLKNTALLKGTKYEVAPEDMATPQDMGPQPSANGKPPAEEGPPQPSAGRSGSRQEARTASIMGAAALALRQCRAKAGARLRSHQHSCDECKRKTDGLHSSLVAAVLGAEQVHEFGEEPLLLVQGGSSEFRGLLSEWGIKLDTAEILGDQIERYAAKTLFDRGQPELPPGFMAQVEFIEEVGNAVVN